MFRVWVGARAVGAARRRRIKGLIGFLHLPAVKRLPEGM
jgi:hypothetical protein